MFTCSLYLRFCFAKSWECEILAGKGGMDDIMDRAVLYLRLSKEDADKLSKGDDSESIINQRLLLTDYAITHNMKIVDIYSDDDYSGLYDDRPEFERLIRDSKLGTFDVVIAKSQSRFTRNMAHMEKYLHHDFPLLGIRFIGVVDGVDTQNQENKKSRQINGLVNEWYCEDLSNNIRAVFRQKMKEGQYVGGFAPYGYRKDPTDKHQFLIDEPAAEVVRKIYALFLEGYSLYGIRSYLEDNKIPNPTIYKQQQGLNYKNVKADAFSNQFGLWSITTLKRILSNKTYIGRLEQGTCRKVSYKDKKVVAVPEEEWYVTENHHEAIITEQSFQKVQEIRSQRRVRDTIVPEQKKVHIFAGKIKCADCGHTMIKVGGVRNNKNDRYLKCQLANKSRGRLCTSHSIKFSEVEKAVSQKIKEITEAVLKCRENRKQVESLFVEDKSKDVIQEKHRQIKEIERNLERASKSVKLLYLDRSNGSIDEEIFFQLKEEFESECRNLKEQKEKIMSELKDQREQKNEAKAFEEWLKNYMDYTVLTYETVNELIESIKIGEKDQEKKEQHITIYWRF